jgi:hypothetical protein
MLDNAPAGRLILERIEHLQELETVKVGVASVDPTYAVFAHQHRGLSIVEQVGAQSRHFGGYQLEDLGMTLGGYQ